jgi:peptidyl-tRNA hydrolase, PTH2 family
MELKQVIVVRKDLNMRKGKMAAQAAHAAMAFLRHKILEGSVVIGLNPVEYAWLEGNQAKIVVGCNSEAELTELIESGKMAGLMVHPIIDSGKTEFAGVPTLTCAAFGPDESEKLDKVTGQLTLL